ncbi:hypothetical protein BKA69DRAFT_639423 [Paraphysoderma sedebokerense]|nr:hypothetical protein BKA69DRAFT_639423 [Paraphysoderma sedebokerense]
MQANQEFRIEDLWTVHLEDLPTDEPEVGPEFDFEKCIFQIFHNCKNDVEKTQNLARQGYLASDEVDSYYKLTDFLNTQVETIYTRAFKNIEDAVKYRDYLNKKKLIAEQRRAQLEAKNQQQSHIPQNHQNQAQFSTSALTAATIPTSDNRSRASNRRNVPLLRQLSGRFEHLNFRKLDQSVTLCKSLPHFVVCTYHCYVWYPLLRPLPRQLITQFKREITELETELMSLDSFKYDFIILHPSDPARLPNATEFAQNYQAENARSARLYLGKRTWKNQTSATHYMTLSKKSIL